MTMYNGCVYCRQNGGSCSDQEAHRRYLNGVKTIRCIPMSDVDIAEYPVKCIKNWFGKGTLVCENCGLVIPAEDINNFENYKYENKTTCSCCGNAMISL